MEEEISFIIDTTQESMSKSLDFLKKEFANIRAGKASPAMLGSIVVEYYGVPTPLNQMANVTAPDGRTIIVQPYEKSTLQNIEHSIMVANLGFNPMNNGEALIINVPPLTEERRRELAKMAKAASEEAKILIRNARKEGNSDVKKLENASEDMKTNTEIDIQKITDDYIKKVDALFLLKEQEIMTV